MKAPRMFTVIITFLAPTLCWSQEWGEGCFNIGKDSVKVFYNKKTNWVTKRVFYFANGKVKGIEYYNDYNSPVKTLCYYENGKKKEMHSRAILQKKKIQRETDIYWDEKGNKKKVVKDEKIKLGID